MNEKSLGVKSNFQKAYDLCSGDIIFSCDQDDVWRPNKVEIMLNAFEDDECVLAFSDAFVTDSNLVINGGLWAMHRLKYEDIDSHDKIVLHLMNSVFVTGATMAFRQDLWTKCRPIGSMVIQDEWLSLTAPLFGHIVSVPQKLIYYRRHSGTVTQITSFERLVDKEKKKNSLQRKLNKFTSKLNALKSASKEERFGAHYFHLNAVNSRIDSFEKPNEDYVIQLKNAIKVHGTMYTCSKNGNNFQLIALLTKMIINGTYEQYRGRKSKYFIDIAYCILAKL